MRLIFTTTHAGERGREHMVLVTVPKALLGDEEKREIIQDTERAMTVPQLPNPFVIIVFQYTALSLIPVTLISIKQHFFSVLPTLLFLFLFLPLDFSLVLREFYALRALYLTFSHGCLAFAVAD